MRRLLVLGFMAALFPSSGSGHDPNEPAEMETRYLAFQIFTYYSPDPKVAALLSSGSKEQLLPGKAGLRDYVLDIKKRIGTVGDEKTRLAVMLGPLCFEQSDAQTTKFIELAFDLPLETDVAVGFHIDDSIFWSIRKDLWSDPKNVETLDWDGTLCKSRRLDWGKEPTEAPPQMCFNSKVIQREVRQRLRPDRQGHRGRCEKVAGSQKTGTVRRRDCRMGDHDRAGFQDEQVSRLSCVAQPRFQPRTPAEGHGCRT